MSFIIALLVVGLAALAHQWWAFQHERVAPLLDDWARVQRVTVVRAERRLVDTGPFSPWTAPDLPVYRVTVRDAGGERQAWLQFGELVWGVLSPAVVARWEE